MGASVEIVYTHFPGIGDIPRSTPTSRP